MHKILTNFLGKSCAHSPEPTFTFRPLFQNSGSDTDLLMARAGKT